MQLLEVMGIALRSCPWIEGRDQTNSAPVEVISQSLADRPGRCGDLLLIADRQSPNRLLIACR
jgi:hypothetical protein